MYLMSWKRTTYDSRRSIEVLFFFSSRRRHTRFDCDWSSDVCSSNLPMHVEPVEHELPVQSSFMMHMRPVTPGAGLKRQNPKPGSRLAVGTIGERLEISSVTVSRRMRSTGSTLVTVIVQATGSPKLAMGMGTQDVHSPPGDWSADVHRSPPLGPPTQMVAVQMPFGTPGGLSQSRSLAHASVPFGPPPAVC